jgi:hypothetical protein
MRARLRLTAMAAGLALAAGAAGAADFPGLDDAVPGHPHVTYLDLLRQVVPSLAANAANRDVEGQLDKPLRHIAGKTYEGDPPDPLVANSFVEVRQIVSGGKKRLVVLADLGADPDRAYNTALLALYDDGPKPRLLDAVDVGVDRDTAFDEQPQLALGPGDTALITISEHLNSNQSYDPRLLIMVRNDRFHLIDQMFLISERACGWERTETPIFATRPDPGSPYAAIEATVTETLKRTDDDCGEEPVPKAYKRIWKTLWRWDAKKSRYVDTAHGLDRLEKLNAGRL